MTPPATIAALVSQGKTARPELAARLDRAAVLLRSTAPHKASPPAARLWQVPSQSRDGVAYLVDRLDASCTCPDHREHRNNPRRGAPGGLCKHRLAVEMICRLAGEAAPQPADLTEALYQHIGLLS